MQQKIPIDSEPQEMIDEEEDNGEISPDSFEPENEDEKTEVENLNQARRFEKSTSIIL
jgi:hypothetical protein